MAKSVHERAKADLQDISMAQTQDEANAALDLLNETCGMKYEKAAAKSMKGCNELLTFYNFTAEH